MEMGREPEDGFSFSGWLRTGRLVRIDARWGAREVKFNPNHDPDNGRFTFSSGGGASPEQPAKRPRRTSNEGSWGSPGFSGGGGGSFNGAGATGYHMTRAEVQAYQRQHPGRDPYLAQPGDTLAGIAAQHGLAVEQVRRLNGLDAHAMIKPRQTLALPSGSL